MGQEFLDTVYNETLYLLDSYDIEYNFIGGTPFWSENTITLNEQYDNEP